MQWPLKTCKVETKEHKYSKPMTGNKMIKEQCYKNKKNAMWLHERVYAAKMTRSQIPCWWSKA